MAEWSNAAVSKTVIGVTLSRVRIPPSPQMFYTYILQSKKDLRYYYGCTSDLIKRIKYHNSGKVKSTKSRRPLILIYSEEFESKAEATGRELFFKSIDGYTWLKANKII